MACQTWSYKSMDRLAKAGLLGSLERVNLPMCENYLMGKASIKPFSQARRASYPLVLVHFDICGPINIKARHGVLYFLTFMDDYSRFGFGYMYLLSHRHDVLDCFKSFVAQVKNQQERNLKTLHTDIRREYLSEFLKLLCDAKWISRQLTILGMP